MEVAAERQRGANEAEGYPNGIGLIKLMGRHSGFIAAKATLAQQDVNFVLIPEVDFDLEGTQGASRHCWKNGCRAGAHAVIVVAEGAGQKYFLNEDPKSWTSPGTSRAGRTSAPSSSSASIAHFARSGAS